MLKAKNKAKKILALTIMFVGFSTISINYTYAIDVDADSNVTEVNTNITEVKTPTTSLPTLAWGKSPKWRIGEIISRIFDNNWKIWNRFLRAFNWVSSSSALLKWTWWIAGHFEEVFQIDSSGNLNMNWKRITNVWNPQDLDDVITKRYIVNNWVWFWEKDWINDIKNKNSWWKVKTTGDLEVIGNIKESGTLLNAKYLWILAKAANSDKLDWIDSTGFIQVNTTWDQILDGTIDSSEIENNTLTSLDLAPNSVWASELREAESYTINNLSTNWYIRHKWVMQSSGNNYYSTWMKFKEHQYWNSLILWAGWLTAIWAWESAWQVHNNVSEGNEILYLTSDSWIKLTTNLQTGWWAKVDAIDIASNWNVDINKELNVDGNIKENWTLLNAKYLWISAKAADADKLDWNDSSFFRNASNINAWTLANARLNSNVTILGQTIESSEIADNTITESDISDSFVARNADKLDWIDSTGFIQINTSWDQILDGTIDSSEIQDDSIYSADILNNTITESDISDSFIARNSNQLQWKNTETTLTNSNWKIATSAAVKTYVDNLVNGLTWKAPVASSASATYWACNASKESWSTYNKSNNIIYVCNWSSWVQMSSTVGLPNLAWEVTGSITSNVIANNVINSANVENGTLTYSDTNVNSIQRRVSSSCPAGSSIRVINSNWTVTCETDTDTNTWRPISNSVSSTSSSTSASSSAVRNAYNLANWKQNRVSWTCSAGSSIRAIASNWTVTCETDTDTNTDTQDLSISWHTISLTNWGSVTVPDNYRSISDSVSSTSSSISASSKAVKTTYDLANWKQNRVTGSCSAGSSIRAIASNWTVTCETDDSGWWADNLWNHTATATLNMNGKRIDYVNWIHVRSDWVRVYWSKWIFFQNHGWGWFMTDSTWIRAYGNKNIYTGWQIKAGSFIYSSDRRLKKEIKTVDWALEKIKKIRWVNFKWKKDDKKDLWFIAQEIEKVFPDLVTTDEETWMKAVKYGNLVSPVVEAIKELSNKVDNIIKQQEKIKTLENKVNNLEKRLERLEKIVK